MGIPARLKKFRPGYRVTSVFAGAVVFAGAAFFAAGGANADTEKLPQAFDGHKRAGASVRSKVVSPDKKNKLPNVTKATTPAPKLGKFGAPFEAPVKVEPKIVNGQNASAADHPYIIGLQTRFYVDEGGEFLTAYISTCTGTVIAPNKVLTAGHCAHDTAIGTTYVIAGRNHLDTAGVGFVTTVRSTFIHQGYTDPVPGGGAPNNDVAVLTLTNDLPAAYTPIALSPQGDESFYTDGTSAQIVGYGVTGPSNADHKQLRSATIPVRSDSSCSGIGPFQNATMLCAGGTSTNTCFGDSGGPIIVNRDGVKTEVGVTSWGPNTCTGFGAYAQVSAFSNLIKADIARKSPSNLDWTGDGHSDLFARDGAGDLYLYSGSGLVNGFHPGAFAQPTSWEGSGWAGFRKLFRTYNWNGDRTPSIFGVLPNGNLYQYRGNGEGNFTTAQSELIGSGWTFTDILVTNNWTGNGRPNLLGRAANGDLWLYTSNGNGGWENNGTGIKIGSAWNMFNTVLTPGDWLGDGRQALIGRTPAGDLRLYQSNGQGGWVNGTGVQIGNGWNIFSIFMSPGDFNGDNLVDMIGITPAGQMRLYMTDGRGNWLNGLGQEIGTGWNSFTAVF